MCPGQQGKYFRFTDRRKYLVNLPLWKLSSWEKSSLRHCVSLSGHQDPGPRLTNTRAKIFFVGKTENMVLLNVGGAATGATLGLLWGPRLTIQLWQIKIPANCPVIVLTCENCDWVLNWNLHAPHVEVVNNFDHNIYLNNLLLWWTS